MNLPSKLLRGFDDSSWRLAWIRQHREHREIAVRYSDYHPTRGWALKRGIEGMNVFDGKILNSNSKGLRGKTEYDYQRTPGNQRILVLGDSFTFGTEVSDDETYSHYLESSLPHTEVINLGVQGYGHDQMLLYLKEEGVKYHPDLVILGFVFWDIYRNLLKDFGYAKPKFDLIADGLQLTNVPVPSPDRVLAEEPYRLKTLDLMVILRGQLLLKLGVTETRARDLTQAILNEMVKTTRSIGAVPVFIYLPVRSEYEGIELAQATNHERYLESYCRERGIACLFLGAQFRKEAKRGVNLNAKGHWNPVAHRLAAQEMKDFLRRSNLIQNASASRLSGKPHVQGEIGYEQVH